MANIYRKCKLCNFKCNKYICITIRSFSLNMQLFLNSLITYFQTIIMTLKLIDKIFKNMSDFRIIIA